MTEEAAANAEELSPAQWQVRATAAELLAFSFLYPSDQLVAALQSGEWLDAAREIAAASGVQLPEGFGEQDLTLNRDGQPVDDPETLKHALRAESTRLFVGAPDPVVSPYEGIWRAEDDGVQGLLFVNPHSMDVERFFKACGLGRPEGTNEPLDHVTTEFEALEYLASLAAGPVHPDDAPALESFPGGSPAAAYAQFMDEHVKVWVPRFAEKVQRETRLPYHHTAAQLLAAFVA